MKKNLFRFFIISIILIISLLFAIPSYVFGIDTEDTHQTTDSHSTDTNTTTDTHSSDIEKWSRDNSSIHAFLQNHSSHHDVNEMIPDTTISHFIQNHSTHHDDVAFARIAVTRKGEDLEDLTKK